MQFHEFLGHVQNRAHLSSLDEALRATRATLQTLSERLAGGEPHNLAAQLPHELQSYVEHDGETKKGERFSSDEFLHRVSEREGVDLPVAVHHARVVIEVLSEAVSPPVIQHVRQQLPGDFQRLFEAGSTGKMPPATP